MKDLPGSGLSFPCEHIVCAIPILTSGKAFLFRSLFRIGSCFFFYTDETKSLQRDYQRFHELLRMFSKTFEAFLGVKTNYVIFVVLVNVFDESIIVSTEVPEHLKRTRRIRKLVKKSYEYFTSKKLSPFSANNASKLIAARRTSAFFSHCSSCLAQ